MYFDISLGRSDIRLYFEDHPTTDITVLEKAIQLEFSRSTKLLTKARKRGCTADFMPQTLVVKSDGSKVSDEALNLFKVWCEAFLLGRASQHRDPAIYW